MPLNYTAVEYEAELESRKQAGEDAQRDTYVGQVIDAINAVDKYVDLPDGVDETAINDVLASDDFVIVRATDVDDNGNCKYRIKTIKREEDGRVN